MYAIDEFPIEESEDSSKNGILLTVEGRNPSRKRHRQNVKLSTNSNPTNCSMELPALAAQKGPHSVRLTGTAK